MMMISLCLFIYLHNRFTAYICAFTLQTGMVSYKSKNAASETAPYSFT